MATTPSHEWEIINRARENVPVDVMAVALALGVHIRVAFLDPAVSGMIEKSGQKFVITVNHQDAPVRRRFTIAHELGHYMLHRHLIGDGLDDDRAYRSTNVGKYHNTKVGPREETEANRFAANLLMPKELVERERARLFDSVADMAALFGVSEHAMSIRMGIDGF